MSKPRLIGMVTAGALVIAIPLVADHEGKENKAYRDPVGIVTICHGHTATARMGQVKSDAECRALLHRELSGSFTALNRTVRVPVTEEQAAALASLVYNIGETKFRNSTLLKKLNAGDTKGACNEFLRWQYAGGKPLFGLAIRRADERALCLSGLN